jgi:hypothetical protein
MAGALCAGLLASPLVAMACECCSPQTKEKQAERKEEGKRSKNASTCDSRVQTTLRCERDGDGKRNEQGERGRGERGRRRTERQEEKTKQQAPRKRCGDSAQGLVRLGRRAAASRSDPQLLTPVEKVKPHVVENRTAANTQVVRFFQQQQRKRQMVHLINS